MVKAKVGLAACMGASRQTTEDPLEVNRLVVREFFDLAFTQRRPGDAATRFMAAPPVAFNRPLSSPRAYAASVIGWVDTMPHLSVDVVRLVCEGDFVVVQSNFAPGPGLRAMLVLDLFKLEDGKIVEHWDALQQVHGHPVRLPKE